LVGSDLKLYEAADAAGKRATGEQSMLAAVWKEAKSFVEQ